MGVQQATGNTWNSGDSITGNGKTIVSLIANGGDPQVVTVNNVAKIDVNSAASTEINAGNFTNVAQMWIASGTSGTTLTAASAALSTTYGISSAREYTYDINFRGSTGASDTAQLAAVGAGTRNATTGVTSWATFDVVSGDSIEAISLLTGGTNHVRLTGSAETDVITLTGDGTNNIEVTAAAAALTLDASATTGTNTLRLGTLLSTTDTVTGGSGRDTVFGTISAGAVTPTISDVEALNLTFTAASTFNAKNVDDSVDTITITPTAAATLTNINESVTTLRVGATADLAGDAVSVTYATGSNSDVAFNIGATPTSSSTATAEVSIGALTLSNNAGALNVNSIGRGDAGATNVIASIAADDVSSVTLTADTTALDVTGAISADSATAFTVDAALLDVTVGGAFTSTVLGTLNVTSGGGDADIDDVTVTAEADEALDLIATITSGAGIVDVGVITADTKANDGTNLSFTMNVTSGSGDVTVDEVVLDGNYAPVAATTNKGSTAVDVTIVAADGDVTVTNGFAIDDGSANNVNATSSATLDLTAQNRATLLVNGLVLTSVNATDVTLAAVDRNATVEVNTVTGTGELDTVTVSAGAGAVTFTGGYAGATDVIVDSTAHTGAFTLDLTSATGALDVQLGDARSGTQNTVTTGAGADNIVGGTGVDVVRGNGGVDTATLGAGNDTYIASGTANDANDVIDGGTGTNTLRIAATTVFAAVDGNIQNMQNVTLDNGGIGVTLTGQTEAFSITGGTGADTIVSGSGNDTVLGGDGADVITTAAGNDSITGGAGADTINAGSGTNVITDAGVGADVITHNSAASTVAIAVTNIDTVTLNASEVGATATIGGADLTTDRSVDASGSSAAVTINGAALTGDGTYTGGSGADTITGGAGDDTITGGRGIDTVNLGTGTDTVSLEGIILSADRDVISGFTQVTDDILVLAADISAGDLAEIQVEANPAAINTDINWLSSLGNEGLLEFSFDMSGLNALGTDGTGLLANVVSGSGALTVETAGDTGYILAYQDGNAYLYFANDTGGTADLAATEIALVATLNTITAGSLDLTNFIAQ